MTATMTRSATPAHLTDLDVTLPAQLLWGAAQCAHTDDWKGALVAVQIELRWNDADSVHATIRSCDGCLAYRVATIAKGSCDALTSSQSEPVQVLILAAPLRKILKTEKSVTFESWDRTTDVAKPGAKQMPGWPRTIRQKGTKDGYPVWKLVPLK